MPFISREHMAVLPWTQITPFLLNQLQPEYGEFKIAENVLHLIYNQGMIWYVPLNNNPNEFLPHKTYICCHEIPEMISPLKLQHIELGLLPPVHYWAPLVTISASSGGQRQ